MSIIKKSNHNYNTSTDYERLWTLAQSQRVVCFIDYEGCRDVCTARVSVMDDRWVELSARGIGYIGTYYEADFISSCEEYSVEFIEPEDSASNDLFGPHVRSAIGGRLSPTWVEWLMGCPLEWTDLKASGTDKFRRWQLQHSQS